MIRAVLAPVTAAVTYRRFVHLLLGAVVALAYGAVATLLVLSVRAGGLDLGSATLLSVAALTAGTGVALVPGVRTLEIAAARALLGADVAEPDPATVDAWPARVRGLLWLLVVVVAGSAVALAALVVVPWSLGLLFAPWVPQPGVPTGVAAVWAPPVAVALPLLLLHLVSGLGAMLARLAPRLLGPSEAERLAVDLAAAQRAGRAAAHRTRLARELHDSIGHALTVSTLQAGAAARVLDSDPAFVARALDSIAEAGRTALDELDHVLGVLRDGAEEPPAPDLGDLDALLAGARSTGMPVEVEQVGDLAGVPGVLSREAYRIVQESLTNALRHAGPVPVTVVVAVTATEVRLEVGNPGAPHRPRPGGGRGLAGMAERVALLGGELTAGADVGEWRVVTRLPIAPRRPE